MEMDLHADRYERAGYDQYIYGSAEVVGLMCLRVFVEGDAESYGKLKPAARSLRKHVLSCANKKETHEAQIVV